MRQIEERLKPYWERLKAGGEGDNRGWDGCMSSPAQWTWNSEGQGKLICCSPWGHKESDKTERLNNNKTGDSGKEEDMTQFGSVDTMKNWKSPYLSGDISLSNSMKLWAMPHRASQDGCVMMESSNKTWSTGEGNAKPLQCSCIENVMNSMKKQKDEVPRSIGAQYTTGDQWRNNSRKNEQIEPKHKKTELWMWLVMEARSDAIKLQAILHRNIKC